ncbi:MAG: CofH family radical SAM protein [Desulfatitalea sp.]|nr:CofH family radical SAM protein [Desulfatitalea sp.]NNK00770.1 CofH family radical SAM protein [Desulfatitalea sp.]
MASTNSPTPVLERLDRQGALDLFVQAPLGELMAAAHTVRTQRHPRPTVTFVCDTNPNYTNVCETRCRFCAFCRSADASDAYTLTPAQVAERVRRAADQGATTVLLQGGHNPAIRLKHWLAYIRAIRAAAPGIHIHPFSPAEYQFVARQEQTDPGAILQAVYDEGVRTIPGGGAEILSERVRQRIAPGKADTHQWLAVCEAAHRIGFRTTATMMFGHVETDAEIVDHLLLLRDLQDRTGGFTSFIPWSFKPGETPLGREINGPVHPAKYVRIIALARLVLDNFEHIQSSWFSENIAAGQLGLLAGANDFGGILIEEHVHRLAGHARSTTVEDVKTIIRRTGFTPVQRDANYRVLQTYEAPAAMGVLGKPE